MDFLTLNWNKLDSLPEFATLLVIVGVVAVAVYYIINQKRTQAVSEIDEKTIASYKNALESTRVDLQTQLDHCSANHEKSEDQIRQQDKKIAGLQGEVKTLREIPLSEMSKGIENIMNTNGKILETLQASAITLAKENTKISPKTVVNQTITK